MMVTAATSEGTFYSNKALFLPRWI